MFRPKLLTRCSKEAAALSGIICSKSWKTSCTKFNQKIEHLLGDLLNDPGQRKTRTLVERTAEDENVFKESSNVASLSVDDIGLHRECSNKNAETIRSYQTTVLDHSRKIKGECDEKLLGSSVSLFSRLMPFLNSEQIASIDKTREFPLLNKEKSNLAYKLPDNGIINMNYIAIFSGKEMNNIPSVTKILNATMSEKAKIALENWKTQMIKQHGEEGFKLLNKEKLQQGSVFHNFIRQYLVGSSLDVFDSAPENVCKLLKSLKLVLRNVTNVSVIESHVVHSRLPYRGIIDCVATYNGRPAVIEWKCSDKKKRYLQWTYDAPIQMSAYLGALNYDDNYRLPVKSGIIIVSYTDGSPADVFWLSQDLCQRYWKIWLSRLHQYLMLRINL